MTDYSAKITAIEDAIASGELTVETDGDRVTYRSIGELMKARDYFAARRAEQLSQHSASTVAWFDPD